MLLHALTAAIQLMEFLMSGQGHPGHYAVVYLEALELPVPDTVKQRSPYDYRVLLTEKIKQELTDWNRIDIELYKEFGGG